jgi:hypothetical protein
MPRIEIELKCVKRTCPVPAVRTAPAWIVAFPALKSEIWGARIHYCEDKINNFQLYDHMDPFFAIVTTPPEIGV